ncbi:peroxisomal-coenzyme A synthetase protein [Rutstroemia sp. NJR-2017a BVV2]|nr:peroxisomal-coenzyme A synthetase protein [Rutstroemia sp. NJR-2017a BVV2]
MCFLAHEAGLLPIRCFVAPAYEERHRRSDGTGKTGRNGCFGDVRALLTFGRPMSATTLANSFSQDTDATAIIIPGKQPLIVTYTQLSAEVLSFQKKLAKLGVTAQSAVSIALPNSYEFIVAFLAAAWQRGIAAPLNSAYKQEEFEFYIDDLKSAVALVPKDSFAKDGAAVRAARKYNAAVAECYWNGKEVVLDVKDEGKLKGKGNQTVEQAQPEDVALVLHTSGTTGRPKAVPLTHRNLTRTMKNIQTTYKLTPADRTMLVMPLFHVHGLLAGFLAPLLSGGSVIVPPKFSASEFWADFITHKANWYTAVPTIHQILLKNPPPTTKPNIRFIRSCSSPLSPTTFHQLEEQYNAPVLEAYAMTEAAHQMTSNPLPPGKRQPGSVGIGQGVEIRILDLAGEELPTGSEGEICIRGENVTKGYLNNEKANQESFTKDGFFRTGDQGKKDQDGYLFITGRIKELINKGGEKISPIELDNVLARHPAVSEAVSFAIPDEMYGQDIGVAIVLKPDEKLDASELKKWVADKLAKFKVPKQVYFTEVMPKTATGKIQRRIVADTMLKQPKSKL